MSYGILEEAGETKRVAIAHSDDNYHLEIRVAVPEYLLDGMTPFYFDFFKPDEEDPERVIYATHNVCINDFEDFKTKSKEKAEEKKIPMDIYKQLLLDVESQIDNGFDDPHEYFYKTENKVDGQIRQTLDDIYENIPGNTIQEKNKNLLIMTAQNRGLPLTLPFHMPDYASFDRKLTPAEIEDDMENRRMSKMRIYF